MMWTFRERHLEPPVEVFEYIECEVCGGDVWEEDAWWYDEYHFCSDECRSLWIEWEELDDDMY